MPCPIKHFIPIHFTQNKIGLYILSVNPNQLVVDKLQDPVISGGIGQRKSARPIDAPVKKTVHIQCFCKFHRFGNATGSFSQISHKPHHGNTSRARFCPARLFDTIIFRLAGTHIIFDEKSFFIQNIRRMVHKRPNFFFGDSFLHDRRKIGSTVRTVRQADSRKMPRHLCTQNIRRAKTIKRIHRMSDDGISRFHHFDNCRTTAFPKRFLIGGKSCAVINLSENRKINHIISQNTSMYCICLLRAGRRKCRNQWCTHGIRHTRSQPDTECQNGGAPYCVKFFHRFSPYENIINVRQIPSFL